jgi:hypothetical protein
MKKQGIFDKVCDHLISQGERSRLNGGNTCVYLNAKGLKCAVGCLIPNKHYTFELEGISLFVDRENSKLLYEVLEKSIGKLTKDTVEILMSLQDIHDSGDVSKWAVSLRDLATKFSLTQPKCIRTTP